MNLKLFGRNYILSAATEKGPRDDNQDSFAWAHYCGETKEGSVEICPNKDVPETFIAVICDGMGGLDFGSKMSSEVCNGLIREMAEEPYADLEEFKIKIRPVLSSIEEKLREELPNSGTTLVSVVAVADEWCIMHLGDSRIYHKESEWKRTLDHSPVEKLLSNGLIDEEEALTHPMRNLISKYIGGGFAKEVEIELIRSDEEVILCTDGAFGCMKQDEFINAIINNDASGIVRNALVKGSKDNITVMCLIPESS